MEPFRVSFTGQPNWGTKQSAVIGRHADLLYSTYVEVVLPYYAEGSTANPAYWNDRESTIGSHTVAVRLLVERTDSPYLR